MRYIFIVMAFFLLSCGGEAEYPSHKMGELNWPLPNKYRIVCIDNVQYIAFDKGISGHFKADGTLYTCESSKGG